MEAMSHALLIFSFIARSRSGAPPRRASAAIAGGEEVVEESDGLGGGGGGVGEWGDTEELEFEFSLCCFLAFGPLPRCRGLIGCRPCGLSPEAWAVCETGLCC